MSLSVTTDMAVQYIYDKIDKFSILAIKSGICEVDSEEMVMEIMKTIIKKKREFDGHAPLNVYIVRGMKKQTAKFYRDKYVSEFSDRERYEQMNLARKIINDNRERYS